MTRDEMTEKLLAQVRLSIPSMEKALNAVRNNKTSPVGDKNNELRIQAYEQSLTAMRKGQDQLLTTFGYQRAEAPPPSASAA